MLMLTDLTSLDRELHALHSKVLALVQATEDRAVQYYLRDVASTLAEAGGGVAATIDLIHDTAEG